MGRKVVTLDVPPEMYEYVSRRLREGGWDHALVDDPVAGPMIDMHGIALIKTEGDPVMVTNDDED